MEGEGPCATVLTSATVDLLLPPVGSYVARSDLRCIWTNRFNFDVLLLGSTRVSLGATIAIAQQIVRHASLSNVFASGSTTLLAPLLTPEIMATITGPAAAPTCAQSVLLEGDQSSGGGAFGLLYNWSSYVGKVATRQQQELSAYITNLQHTSPYPPSLTLPLSLLSGGSAEIFLNAHVKGLGSFSASTSFTLIQSTQALPMVTIQGPRHWTQSALLPAQVEAVGVSPCQGTSAPLAYAWTISPPIALPAVALSRARLVLPSYALTAGQSYTLSVRTSLLGQDSIAATATVTVHVALLPPVASIVRRPRGSNPERVIAT